MAAAPAQMRQLRPHRLLRQLPSQHASAHYEETGHPVIQSFEPGKDWYYDNRTDEFRHGPNLADPPSHPINQSVPGPAGAVPADWERHLNR
jgi:hypothetical protein